jgi:CRISPR-associated protein Cas2
MLYLVGYDISCPRRLRRVANVCQDYGLRVQCSFFECHLDERVFERFWARLLAEIEPGEDRVVAYELDARSARRTRRAGTMAATRKAEVYVV